ncbi:MAG: saccharopine dehydrogenase family protein [Myxococcota bacterium]
MGERGKRIVVLGAAGGIGRVATEALSSFDVFDRIAVADVRRDAARQVVDALGDRRMAPRVVDATDPSSLAAILEDADVVLNCVGPFYRFGPPILEAAIEAGVDYVDVCDDLEPTRRMLEMDGRARERGVRALLGMGNSPGLANVFVRLCADGLLDRVEGADIMHVHGGEPDEGPAVVQHRIHAMKTDIPLFVDGEFVSVRQLEESGQAYVVETDFHDVGRCPVHPYPHPETITLPQHIPGLRRATNLGVILPLSYFRLTQDMVRAGACSEAPLSVRGRPVVPLDVSVAHILSRRAELLAEAGMTGPTGCLKVVVSGERHGEPRSYVFQLSSRTAGAGEGTGIPAAAGAVLMARGAVEGPGVLPPEAAVKPLDALGTAFEAVRAMGRGGRDSIRIEQVDADGTVSPVPLPF